MNYIRKLIKQFPDKNFIFLSPELTTHITDPSFIDFALNKLKNAVLIIEDAEMLLTKRGATGNNAAVSVLLNMTDGMMKDALKLKIICTANCKMADIDEALLRKGRILTKYEFKKLIFGYFCGFKRHIQPVAGRKLFFSNSCGCFICRYGFPCEGRFFDKE